MAKLNHTVRSNRIKTNYGYRKSYWQGGSGKYTKTGGYVDFGTRKSKEGYKYKGTEEHGYRDLRTTKAGSQRDYYRELRERNENIEGAKAEALQQLKYIADTLGEDMSRIKVDFNRIYGYENNDVEAIERFMKDVGLEVNAYEQVLAQDMVGAGVNPYNIEMSDGTNYGETHYGDDSTEAKTYYERVKELLNNLGKYY